MKATVEVVQCRAVDVEPGDTVRVTHNGPWQLVIEVVHDPDHLGQYEGYEDVKNVLERIDDWYVALCMNRLPNHLGRCGDGRVLAGGTEYHPNDPALDLAILFQGALVDVQVRTETEGRSTP